MIGKIRVRTIFSMMIGTARISRGRQEVKAFPMTCGLGIRVMKWMWQPLLTEFSTSKASPYICAIGRIHTILSPAWINGRLSAANWVLLHKLR